MPDEGTQAAGGRVPNERLSSLEQENRKLWERLRQAELILDIQDKTLKLFGVSFGPQKQEGIDDKHRAD
jgi:hypothetical protein